MTDKTSHKHIADLADKKYPVNIQSDQVKKLRMSYLQEGFEHGYVSAIEECKVKELMRENERLRDHINATVIALDAVGLKKTSAELKEALQPK